MCQVEMCTIFASCSLFLFSCSVMFDPLWPHGQQHTRLPCPSLSLRVCADSCLLKWWCHPNISSCHSLLFLPSIFPSIRVFFQRVSCLRQVAKVLELQLSTSYEYSGLISFRIDWFDLLAVQGTLKSLLQHRACHKYIQGTGPEMVAGDHKECWKVGGWSLATAPGSKISPG